MSDMYDPLKLRLEKLDFRKAAAFCAICAEQLLPNYTKFCLAVDWGDTSILKRALDACWSSLASDFIDRDLLRKLLDECDGVTPDTEDFANPLVVLALDAATSVSYALDCLIESSSVSALWVSELMFNSVDVKLRGVALLNNLSHDDEEIFIRSHPDMVLEASRQERLVELLENTPRLAEATIRDVPSKPSAH